MLTKSSQDVCLSVCESMGWRKKKFFRERSLRIIIQGATQKREATLSLKTKIFLKITIMTNNNG